MSEFMDELFAAQLKAADCKYGQLTAEEMQGLRIRRAVRGLCRSARKGCLTQQRMAAEKIVLHTGNRNLFAPLLRELNQ